MATANARVLGEGRRRAVRALIAGAAILLLSGFMAAMLNPDIASEADVLLAGAVALVGSAIALIALLVLGRTPHVKVAGTVVQVGSGLTAATFDLRGASAIAVEAGDRRGVRWRAYTNWSQLLTENVSESRAVRLRVRDARSGSWFVVPLHDARGQDLHSGRLRDMAAAMASLAAEGAGPATAVLRCLLERTA